jgi:hypothetical protein
VFSDNFTDVSLDSWGNLVDLEAVDADVAFVLFGENGSTPGRLSFTVNGGASWLQVAYPDASLLPPCDEEQFFDGAKAVALLDVGGTTRGVDSDADSVIDSVAAVLFIASRYDTSFNPDSSVGQCGLAKVTIDGETTTWEWAGLERDFYDATACQVDESNILGVSVSEDTTLETASVYVWGAYAYLPFNGSRTGGACAVKASDFSGVTQVVSPYDHPMTVSDVAPYPASADTLFIATRQDTSTLFEMYRQSTLVDPMSNPAMPLFAELNDGVWTVSQLTSAPPNLVGLAAGWGSFDAGEGVKDYLLYGTEGSGAWTAEITW